MGDGTYPSKGKTCDVNATNASFPAIQGAGAGGGGGNYSIDCQPESGKNVSGTGLKIVLDQTTGNQSLTSGLDCDGMPGGPLCACKACTKDHTTPCRSDTDCLGDGKFCSLCTDTAKSSNLCTCNINADCNTTPLGTCSNLSHKCTAAATVSCTTNTDCLSHAAGTCTTQSACTFTGGTTPQPNQCTTGICNDQGGGEGECDHAAPMTGPIDKYCDGLVRADGTGMKACTSDAGCTGGGGYGLCTLLDPRDCFLDPIESQGFADPHYPVGAAVFCVPPTDNSGVNGTAGLPGPGRVVTQARAKTFCPSSSVIPYDPSPGIGCPP
jgi:hypothetical protein